jgi:hypothetical protein
LNNIKQHGDHQKNTPTRSIPFESVNWWYSTGKRVWKQNTNIRIDSVLIFVYIYNHKHGKGAQVWDWI